MSAVALALIVAGAWLLATSPVTGPDWWTLAGWAMFIIGTLIAASRVGTWWENRL
jgi:membrane-bound ClpP family serine protease